MHRGDWTVAVCLGFLVAPWVARAQGALEALPETRRLGGTDAAEVPEWSLAALQVTSDFTTGASGISSGKTSAIILPNLHAEGSVLRTWRGGRLQFKGGGRFSFTAKPSAGEARDVADQIRLSGGTASLNLGARFGVRFNDPKAEGTFGVHARVGLQGGLQLADVTATNADNQLTLSSTGFLIGRIEGALGFWLYYAYIGAQTSGHFASSTSAALKSELSIPSLQVTIIVPLKPINSDQRTVYVQLSASGPYNAIDRTVTLSLGARFEPF